MNRFVLEPLIIGAKEGIILISCMLLVFSFLRGKQREELIRAAAAGCIAALFASIGALSVPAPVSAVLRDGIVKMVGYVFGLFYLLSLGALFSPGRDDLPGPLPGLLSKSAVLTPLVFLSAFLYCLPDMAGSSLYIKDLFAMSGKNGAVLVSSTAGFAAGGMISMVVIARFTSSIRELFALPQILLFLALIKLVGGGIHGFAELSLIASVQAGLMKFIHDVVHQTLVLVMIPDHPLLTLTAWKSVGILFGDALAMWLSLIIITVPLILFIRTHFTEKISVPGDLQRGAARRSFIRSVRDDRILKSIPVFLFMAVIIITWFTERGESLQQVYNPAPTPVTASGELVVIPLRTPAEDVLDGAIHKFAVTIDGKVMRLLLMRKKNGTLAVCFDACEVCPPEGYGQEKEKVICLACRTPIPADSVGNPGGCNPIRLSALVTGETVRISVDELRKKWALTKSSESNGASVP